MATTYTPKRVDLRQFSWNPTERRLVGEISSTNGFGRVYPDACDEGLTVVNPRNQSEMVFVVSHTEVRDGDIVSWTLTPVRPFDRTIVRSMTLFND